MQLICRWVKQPVTESLCHELSVSVLTGVAEMFHATVLTAATTRVWWSGRGLHSQEMMKTVYNHTVVGNCKTMAIRTTIKFHQLLLSNSTKNPNNCKYSFNCTTEHKMHKKDTPEESNSHNGVSVTITSSYAYNVTVLRIHHPYTNNIVLDIKHSTVRTAKIKQLRQTMQK